MHPGRANTFLTGLERALAARGNELHSQDGKPVPLLVGLFEFVPQPDLGPGIVHT